MPKPLKEPLDQIRDLVRHVDAACAGEFRTQVEARLIYLLSLTVEQEEVVETASRVLTDSYDLVDEILACGSCRVPPERASDNARETALWSLDLLADALSVCAPSRAAYDLCLAWPTPSQRAP
ncbi:MAG TPA: hypothetical protein VIL72_07395, partial [Beijerinckiaceae bacterium]